MIVHYELITQEARGAITSYRYYGDESFTINFDNRKMMTAAKVSIERFSEVVDGKEVKITSGDQLLSATSDPARELMAEIRSAIMTPEQLTEEQAKN